MKRQPAEATGIRVMVVDDHPMWREGVVRDLTEAGYEVVAATGEGRQAVRVVGAVRPQVVVLDLQLPDLSGVDVIAGLLATAPDVRILMLSASGEPQDVLDAVKAGATGYLVKSAGRDEFLDAVRRTADGDAVFTGAIGLRRCRRRVDLIAHRRCRIARARDDEHEAARDETKQCR